MSFELDAIVRFFTFEQFLNAFTPIDVIPLGIVNDENPEQPENELLPIVEILFGKVKFPVNFAQPEKEEELVDVIPLLIVKLQDKSLRP